MSVDRPRCRRTRSMAAGEVSAATIVMRRWQRAMRSRPCRSREATRVAACRLKPDTPAVRTPGDDSFDGNGAAANSDDLAAARCSRGVSVCRGCGRERTPSRDVLFEVALGGARHSCREPALDAPADGGCHTRDPNHRRRYRLETIFERFSQGGRRPDGKGLGLGLYIA